jgi:hypothetical protein
MSHCSFLKAIRPEQPTGVQPFLLFRRLCLWHLWSVTPSFPVARLSRWFPSNCSRCSHLKAARPARFPDKVHAGIGGPLSCLFFSNVGVLEVSSFVWEGADSCTESSHSFPAARRKTWLLASRPPVGEFASRSCWMPSRFLDIAAILHIGPHSLVVFRACPSFRGFTCNILPAWFLTTVYRDGCRNGTEVHPSTTGGQLLPKPTTGMDPFFRLSAAPYI